MEVQDVARLDVFLALLAIGWIDRRLDERERALILRAALLEGLGPADLDRLAEAAHWPLSFEDLVPALQGLESRYVYTLASYVAFVDGDLDPTEDAALEAVAQVLGLGESERRLLDDLAQHRAASGEDPANFEPAALRTEITRWCSVAAPPTPLPAFPRVVRRNGERVPAAW